MCGELEDGNHILIRGSETKNWIILKSKTLLRFNKEMMH
jgi:hypothetical protein